MTFFAWIMVGIIAGWVVKNIAERNHDLLTNLVTGVCGALAGGFLSSTLFGFRYAEGVSVPSIIAATIGALILLAIFRGFDNQPS